MNKLMMMICGGRLYMAEAGGEGGGAAHAGGEGGTTAAPAATTEAKPGEGGGAAPAGQTGVNGDPSPAGEQKTTEAKPGEGGEPKSAFAQKVGEGEAKPGDGGEQKPTEQKPGEGSEQQPKQYTDEDFTKAIVASDAVRKASGDESIQLSQELVKGMLPAIRKANLSPEQANELANELAAQQIQAAKAHAEARAADIKTMNDEAMQMFPDKQSWDAIGAGVKHFFKPGGTMYQTIVGSELGSDKEFLTLMKWVGERVAKDNLGGAPGTGGEKSVSYEKALMN